MKKTLLCAALSALACSVPAKADIKFTNKFDKEVTVYLEAVNDKGQKFDKDLVELKKNGETGSSSSITREKFGEIAEDQFNVLKPVGSAVKYIEYTLRIKVPEDSGVTTQTCTSWIPAFTNPTKDKHWLSLMEKDVFNKEFPIRRGLGDPNILLCNSY